MTSSGKSPGNVIGTAFSLDEMRNKLKREIGRLKAAEVAADKTSAVDHALNAAFTGYHLLDWQAKTVNPPDNRNAREILNGTGNADLRLLHDIVTCTKHVTISNSAVGGGPVHVHTSAFGGETLDSFAETSIGNVADYKINSIVVKFANERATEVLDRVLDYFT